MRKYGLLVSAALLTLSYGCSNWLEGVEKIGKYQRIDLMDADGIQTIRAGVLHYIPMEDFNYRPNGRGGWNDRDYMFYSNDLGGVGVGGFMATAHFTDEAALSQGSGLGPGGAQYFRLAYRDNRRISSYLLKDLPEVLANGSISQADYDHYVAEARFVRAYMYYQLVRRYGGVPIITEFQDDVYFEQGPDALFIQRSTEVETWDFVMRELDAAAAALPADVDNPARVSKWAALALKTRAALYAASLAKYGDKVSFAGPAAQQGLVGVPASEANRFYGLAIAAAEEIFTGGKFTLYGANPASAEEAAANYQALFQNPGGGARSEVILWRTYLDGQTAKVDATGHDYDARFWPNQNPGSWHKWGRYSVMLDMVDAYEDYTDDGNGLSAPIETRTDGNEDVYFTQLAVLEGSPEETFVKSIPFKTYDHPYDAFKNKDARLLASVVVPGSTWAGATTIMMQGGLFTPAGKPYLYSAAPAGEATVNGLVYSSWGPIQNTATGAMVDPGAGGYSGFNIGDEPISTHEDNMNFCTSGFTLRKFLNEGGSKDLAKPRGGTTPWIDFRLAEIYLNYAEAVVESGQGNAAKAAEYLNAIRHRAAHKDNIPLTLNNVLKERRVELAFEGHRLYDQMRRREYHTVNTISTRRKALIPMMDLRGSEPKYVFLRADFYFDVRSGSRQFNQNSYYNDIPNYTTNRLVGNPGQE